MAGGPGYKSSNGAARVPAVEVCGSCRAGVDARRGMTLVELLVVVAIVGILAAVAYPIYQEQVRSGRRAVAQSELMRIAQFMERLYTETGCYNPGTDNDCSTTGDAAAPSIATNAAHYSVSFPGSGNPTADAFTLRATPTGAQAGDGFLEINALGQRFWDKNDDGDVDGAGEDSWDRR